MGTISALGCHSRAGRLVTLYHNDGDKEQGVPFTVRLLQPEGLGSLPSLSLEWKRKETSKECERG